MNKDNNKIIQDEALPEIDNIPEDKEFDWDNFEFDFGEEFDEDTRKPVTLKNIIKETGKEFKKIPPSKIASAVEETLPRSIKSDVVDMKDLYSSAAQEFQGYFSKIKKEANEISNKLDKILPKEGKIRALFEKIKLSQEEVRSGRRYIDYKEEEIKRSVKEAIGSEEEFENKKEAIRQSLEERRNRETNKILESISSDVYANKVFAFDYTSRFQRKSLELQYRHLGLLKDLITLNKDLGEKQVEHLKGILINTGLPDVVKNRQMELLGADLKKQFRQNIIDNYIKNNPVLNDIKARFKDRASYYGTALLEKFTNANEKLEDIQDKKEQTEGIELDKNQVVGSTVSNMLLQGMAKLFNTGASKLPFVKKGMVSLKEFKDDPSAIVRRLYDKVEGDGFFADMARAGLSEAEYVLNPRQENTKTKLAREDLNSPSTLDVRTKLSINRVIPAYLRKIHAEVKAARFQSKDEDVKAYELSYDFNSDKFVATGSIGSKFASESRKLMKNRTKSSMRGMKRTLSNDLYTEGLDEKDKLNSREMKKVIEALTVASTESNKTGLKLLESDEVHSKLDKGISEKLSKLTDNIRTKAEDDPDIIEDIRYGTENIRRSIPALNKYIEEMFKEGNIEELEELGLIKYDEQRREYFPNEENIRLFMFATYGIKGYKPQLKDVNEDLFKFADRLSKTADDVKKGLKTKKPNIKKLMKNYSEALESKKNVITKEVENSASKISKDLSKTLNSMSNDTNTDSSVKDRHSDKLVNKDATSNVDPDERSMPGSLGSIRKDPENFTSARDFGFPNASNELKDKIYQEFKEERERELKDPDGKEEKSQTKISSKDNSRAFGDDFGTILKETKELHASMELLSSAAQTNNPDMIKDAINKVNKRGHGSDSRIQAYIRQINEGTATKEKFMKGLESSIDMEKDPEGSMFKLSSILKSGYNMLPMRKTLGLVGKSLKWYIKTGWKIEKWFWKNAGKKMLWDAPKGLLKLTGKAGLGLGKLGLRLGGGLTGIDTSFLVNKLDNASNRLSGRKPGQKGLFGRALDGVGLGAKGAFNASKTYVKGVRGLYKGLGNLITGKPLTEGFSDNAEQKEPTKKKKDKKEDKLINGMTMEEYKKSKEKGKKKKGMFMTILSSMKKILFGLLGGITFLKNFFFKKFLGLLVRGLAGGLSPITAVVTKSIGLLAKGATAVGGAVATAGSFVAEKASGAWNWIKDKVAGVVDKAKEIGGKVVDKVKNAFGALGEKFAKTFPKITEGLGKFKDKVIDLIKKLKKGIYEPIVKKVGKKGAGTVVAKLAGKLGSRALPLGWALLAVDIFFIAKYYCEGLSLKSAICKGIIGFDPWDDKDAVVDDEGNPVKPDEDLEKQLEEDAKKEGGTPAVIGQEEKPNDEEKEKKEEKNKEDKKTETKKTEEKKEEKPEMQKATPTKDVSKETRPEILKVLEEYFPTIDDPERIVAIGYKLTKLDPNYFSETGFGVFNLASQYYDTYLTDAALTVYADEGLADITDYKLQAYCSIKHLTDIVQTKLKTIIPDIRPEWIYEFFKGGGKTMPDVPYKFTDEDFFSDFLSDEDLGKEPKKKKVKPKKEKIYKEKPKQEIKKSLRKKTGSKLQYDDSGNIPDADLETFQQDGNYEEFPINENDSEDLLSKNAPGSIVAEKAGEIARENAEPKSTGSCARYVRTALEKAGYEEPPGRPLSAYQYETTGFINKYGFNKVDAGNPLTFKPKPGDISITKAFNNHKHGHIAIYDGKNWVSDFKQNSISIYRDLPTQNAEDYISIYRDSTKEGSGGDEPDTNDYFNRKLHKNGVMFSRPNSNSLSGNEEDCQDSLPSGVNSGHFYNAEGISQDVFNITPRQNNIQQISTKELESSNKELVSITKQGNDDQKTLIMETNKKLDVLISLLSKDEKIVNGKTVVNEKSKTNDVNVSVIPKSSFDIGRGLTSRNSPIRPMSSSRSK